MSLSRTVIFCRCVHSGIIPEAVKGEALRRLTGAANIAKPQAASDGATFIVVDDLCGLAARGDPLLARAAGSAGVRIAACFPRAVRWLFAFAGAPLAADAQVFNMRQETAEAVVAGLLEGIPDRQGEAASRICETASELRQAASGDGNAPVWTPWFPVIDYSRCHNCRQCANFCLFGVYGLTEQGKVRVQNPTKCKTNCPACARLCPRAAIIFPKYEAAPINGDEVTEANRRRENVGADLAGLVNTDLYAALRRRQADGGERSSKERDAQRALAERLACACGEKDGCPSVESLMSLPAAEALPAEARQILRAAAERAKAPDAKTRAAEKPSNA